MSEPRCPVCGRTVAVSAIRCGYCLAELGNVALVANTRDAVGRPNGRLTSLASTLRGVPRTARIGILCCAFVLATGCWLYATFVREPALLAGGTDADISVSAAGLQWPMVDGDSGATRRTTAIPILRVRPTWTIELDTEVQVRPVADRQRLFIGLIDDRIIAVDTRSGHVAWAYRAPHRLWGAPTIAGDALYLALRNGTVLALSVSDGLVRWTAQVRGSFYAPPAVADGRVMAVAEEGLFGLDASTGALLWHVPFEMQPITVAPLLADGHVSVVQSDGIYVYDARTGVETFRFPQLQPRWAAADQSDIFAISPQFVSAFDAGSRTPWWEGLRRLWGQVWLWQMAPRPPDPASHWIMPTDMQDRDHSYPLALAADRVIIATSEGRIRALHRGTGALLWDVAAGPQAGPPTITPNGLVLAGVADVTLRDLSDGSQHARSDLPAAERRDVIVTAAGTFAVDRTGSVSAFLP